MLRPAVLLLAAAFPAAAADYAGSAACRGCHPAQWKAQSSTGHAFALRRTAEHPQFARFPQRTVYRPPDYRLTWTPNKASVWDGQNEATLPVEWAFGAGQQAVTFVSRFDEERYVEYHLTFYAAPGALAPTPGHRLLKPANAAEAFGAVYRTFAADAAILRCFGCHSTGGLKLTSAFAVEPAEQGVRCEACHGPAAQHARTRRRADVFHPAKLSPGEMNEYCGNCHRPPASDPAQIDWSDPWNVRHQPVYLSRSACFASGKLRCTTCHDPHRPLERSAAVYDRQCASCHTDVRKHGGGGSCVSCHMPKVQPNPHLEFTNHWIGVYRESSKLTPQRQP